MIFRGYGAELHRPWSLFPELSVQDNDGLVPFYLLLPLCTVTEHINYSDDIDFSCYFSLATDHGEPQPNHRRPILNRR